MKLHEALRKTILEYGTAVLEERSLVSLLEGDGAFGDCPDMLPVMEAIFTRKYGHELSLRSSEPGRTDLSLYLDYLGKSLVKALGFSTEQAGYAVYSVSFALGLCPDAPDPIDINAGQQDPFEEGADDSGEPEWQMVRPDDAPEQDEKESTEQDSDPEQAEPDAPSPEAESLRDEPQAPQADAPAEPAPTDAAEDTHDPDIIPADSSIGAALQDSEKTPEPPLTPASAERSGDSEDPPETGPSPGEAPAAPESPSSRDDGAELYARGEMYCYGRGERQDYAEAVRWYLKAAEHGSTDAEYSLGHMYSCGQGVQRDNEKAIEWFRRAAEHGSADARRRIQNILRSIGRA
ncbi:MAG: hypothetical protein PUG73_06805 [Pseudomonadota bacterium]|nr:hypothetical protein [Pseudomonadota bacterium]